SQSSPAKPPRIAHFRVWKMGISTATRARESFKRQPVAASGPSVEIYGPPARGRPVQERGAGGEGLSGLSRGIRYALGRRVTGRGTERAQQPRHPVSGGNIR